MKQKVKSIAKRWKDEYEFKTLLNTSMSFFITIVFAAYNCFFGIKYKAIWNLSISVYYAFLAVVRGIIVRNERLFLAKGYDSRQKIHLIVSVLLLIMNFSLAVPISFMVINKRNVATSMIPTIAMATYTTYKMMMASINLKRSKKSDDVLIRDLRNINFIDAIMSLLTLQNTMLVVHGSINEPKMFILSAITSAAGLAAIALLTILNMVRKHG